jgi:PKD domain
MAGLERPRISLALVAALLALACAPVCARAAVYPGDPLVGPTPALHALGGVDLAPDGTGALVTTIDDGGVAHVFVNRLVNGGWSAPERVDGALPGASSQPVVAAGDGGRVVVAFVNEGNVYAVTRAGAGAGYGAPQAVWGGGGASSPALDVSVNGKEYLAFTAPGAGGHDVRVAYAANAAPFALAAAPLDGNPASDAGTGPGRAALGASATGTAVVAWGEAGHVFARRVRGTAPSVVFADANAGLSVEGVPAADADTPVVGVQDDDAFEGVAFRADFVVGGAPRSRVVYRRLRGSRFEGPAAVDATPFASGQGSVNPQIATVGTGQGIVLGSADQTFLTFAMLLHGDTGPGDVSQIDSLAASSAPTAAVAAAATALKMLVAWQYTPGAGAPEIHARYYDGTVFEPELLLSRPQLGPTDAVGGGLAASGDDEGDLVVAYVQDVPGAGPAVAVATIDQPPGRFATIHGSGAFQRTLRPVLSWTVSREEWGRYFKVFVDGAQVGVTGRRSLRTAPLAQGVHRWQVAAFDRRGQSFTAPGGTVKVDTIPALVHASVTGARRSGGSLRLTVRAVDAPPPAAAGTRPAQTSGVKTVFVDWGDGVRQTIARGTRHAYRRPGRYTMRVVVTDRAGNRMTVRRTLRIVKPPKPRKHKGKGGHAHH